MFFNFFCCNLQLRSYPLRTISEIAKGCTPEIIYFEKNMILQINLRKVFPFLKNVLPKKSNKANKKRLLYVFLAVH